MQISISTTMSKLPPTMSPSSEYSSKRWSSISKSLCRKLFLPYSLCGKTLSTYLVTYRDPSSSPPNQTSLQTSGSASTQPLSPTPLHDVSVVTSVFRQKLDRAITWVTDFVEYTYVELRKGEETPRPGWLHVWRSCVEDARSQCLFLNVFSSSSSLTLNH